MTNDAYGQQVDKVAELLAQRAKRKLGLPRELRLAPGASEPVARESTHAAHAAEPPSLPDWTSFKPIDVSERARKLHQITLIAHTHGWQIAITHFLMTKGVSYLSDLTNPQIDDLLDRMYGYVDAAEIGASLPDCLPAN